MGRPPSPRLDVLQSRFDVGFVYFLAFFPINPNTCNCRLLATKTKPFATTGTRFELPPRFGHAPAVPLNRVAILLPDLGLNANRLIGALLVFGGCDSAQMIGLALPFDEIEVKNPGSCEPPTHGDTVTVFNATLGEVCTCQTITCRPPLLTTCPKPSAFRESCTHHYL
jgi:hypothetical protein